MDGNGPTTSSATAFDWTRISARCALPVTTGARAMGQLPSSPLVSAGDRDAVQAADPETDMRDAQRNGENEHRGRSETLGQQCGHVRPFPKEPSSYHTVSGTVS
jgi:hypothetical protein